MYRDGSRRLKEKEKQGHGTAVAVCECAGTVLYCTTPSARPRPRASSTYGVKHTSAPAPASHATPQALIPHSSLTNPANHPPPVPSQQRQTRGPRALRCVRGSLQNAGKGQAAARGRFLKWQAGHYLAPSSSSSSSSSVGWRVLVRCGRSVGWLVRSLRSCCPGL
ncbi:uncharacterized protein K452DRAFT_89880 [Aplosporella prunicola CBS 121167]|uniref:Uncharacterized protein n=1 Tax=Aplosporella prunicola CBS 121167 TaxID=1176127 RepID=A0A6A6B3M1_9PEZI|nr:uncharacterized protein K452DRAFT_89880 [Aplosporella prunicola CBS 121167]KAF2138198.1 hypothetical protein K452DRAFT_89880 [Aplosporella prunicola CBS 121167]